MKSARFEGKEGEERPRVRGRGAVGGMRMDDAGEVAPSRRKRTYMDALNDEEAVATKKSVHR